MRGSCSTDLKRSYHPQAHGKQDEQKCSVWFVCLLPSGSFDDNLFNLISIVKQSICNCVTFEGQIPLFSTLRALSHPWLYMIRSNELWLGWIQTYRNCCYVLISIHLPYYGEESTGSSLSHDISKNKVWLLKVSIMLSRAYWNQGLLESEKKPKV